MFGCCYLKERNQHWLCVRLSVLCLPDLICRVKFVLSLTETAFLILIKFCWWKSYEVLMMSFLSGSVMV